MWAPPHIYMQIAPAESKLPFSRNELTMSKASCFLSSPTFKRFISRLLDSVLEQCQSDW